MKRNHNKTDQTSRLIKSALRPEKVNQGFFDGRFYTRAIRNKKKENSRLACRKFDQYKENHEF